MALVRVIFSLRLFGRHRSLQYMPCHTSPAVHALPDSSREQVPHIIFQPNLQYIYRHHHQMGTIPREYIFYLPMTVRQRAVAIGPWQTTGPVTDVSWQLGGGGGGKMIRMLQLQIGSIHHCERKLFLCLHIHICSFFYVVALPDLSEFKLLGRNRIRLLCFPENYRQKFVGK